MPAIQKKIFLRLGVIFKNTAYLAFPPILSALIPILIIKYHTVSWWGHIVELNLIATIVNVILAWGNKDYLVKEFSAAPAKIIDNWAQLTTIRATFLLLPTVALLSFLFAPFTALNVTIWIICRFITQAFEPVIIYERKYWVALISEASNFLITIGGIILLRQSLSLELILLVLSSAAITKSLVLTTLFRKFTTALNKLNFNWRALLPLSNMMLITLTGLFVSKIDLFVVSLTMTKDDLAVYQIIISFAALIQSGATFIFLPYLKSFYRLNDFSQNKLRLSLLQIGIVFCAFSVVILYPALNYFYHLTLTPLMMLGCFLYGLCGFITTPLGFKLYELNRSNLVLNISAASILVFVGMFLGISLITVPTTEQIVALAAIHQLLLASAFVFFCSSASKRSVSALG